MIQKRCVEQLYPASEYSIEDIKEKLALKMKFYPKKKADIQINLNEDGIYVAKIFFLFEENLSIKERLKFLNIKKFKRKNTDLIRKTKTNEKSKNIILSKKDRVYKEKKSEKINLNTSVKENRAIEKYTKNSLEEKKAKKSKYEKHMEEHRVLKPI